MTMEWEWRSRLKKHEKAYWTRPGEGWDGQEG